MSNNDFTVVLELNRVENPRVTVILAAYKKPEYLALVLAGLERQTFRDFELIVCDDGSGQDVADLLASFARSAKLPFVHVWHEDNGFRKCRIMNRGLRMARGEVVVFLDADCVPYPRFIEDHYRESEEGRYLAGRRVELGPVYTAKLSPEAVRNGKPSLLDPNLLWSFLQGDTRHGNRALVVRPRFLRGLMHLDSVPDAKGCNFSVPRKSLLEVNGFDESYEGPAYGEDTDIELRLIHHGLRIKSLRGLAVQYHLYHKQLPYADNNKWRLDELRQTRRVRAVQGMYPD